MSFTSFGDLELLESLQQALCELNYKSPTPIQQQAIPHILEGQDLVGCAQTGTGKTAAFSLPLLQRLTLEDKPREKRRTRSLILTPTRELAEQIRHSLDQYGKHLPLRSTAIYGGVGYNPQIKTLLRGVDVLVATPGRLLDLVSEGHVRLDKVEVLILDEADRMFDMGFIKDLKKLISHIPEERQTLLFSATMPKEVARLAANILRDPKQVSVNSANSTADKIEDHVLFVEREDKVSLLLELLRQKEMKRAIVFTRTKHLANRVSEKLNNNRINAAAIHGNKSQSARLRSLQSFRSGKTRVLVATDLASRGIDVSDVTHVVNFELPIEPECYVHRIGRTARAGQCGVAFSFCDRDESVYLRAIEKLLERKVQVKDAHTHHSDDIMAFHLENKKDHIKPRQGHGGRTRARQHRGPNRRRSSSRQPVAV